MHDVSNSLSLDEIVRCTWSLHRPNGDCRSPQLRFQEDGKLFGYHHPNEASWVPYGDGFAFLSVDGRMTSVSGGIRRNADGRFEICMNRFVSRDQTAHFLVQAGDLPGKPSNGVEEKAGPANPPPRKKERPNLSLDFPIPEPALRYLLPEVSRVFFIANNREIDRSIFDRWGLCEADIVVQYNKAFFLEALAQYSCHKVHFHYPNRKTCWGFTEDGAPERPYESQKFSSLTFAVVDGMPPPVARYFRGISALAQCMAIKPHIHQAAFSYPDGRVPSCGFVSISFFRFLAWIRRTLSRPSLELNLVGFTGRYSPGKAWDGHDFAFEQRVYDTWLDLKRIAADGSLASHFEPERK